MGIESNKVELKGAPAPMVLVLAASLVVGLVIPRPTMAGVDKTVSDVCLKSTDAAFRAKYCTAAKDLRAGHSANIATSAVWTGVSVACGAACGKAASGLVCQIASTGGSAGEGLITKKFADSLMSEGSKWGAQAAAGKAEETTKDAAPEASGKVNTEACVTAGTTALKAYGKFSDSKQNEKNLRELRDQTKEMNTDGGDKSAVFAGTDGPNAAAATADTRSVCTEGAIKTALGAIRCAASADPSLPPYVKSQEFLKDLQKATGKSADAFFADFESPAKSIFDSPTVNALPEAQQRGLADSLSAMEGYTAKKSEAIAAKAGGSASESGGSARVTHDDDTGFDMNGMIAGVLGQMGGADGAKDGGDHATTSLAAARSPAAFGGPEDRQVSLFDRVQGRYGAVSARDRLGAP